MTAFEIQFPYADGGGAESTSDPEEGDSDFEIDSDISDADVYELRQELQKLEPEKVKRQLAAATEAIQKSTMEKWARFCEKFSKNPTKTLKKCNAKAFMTYLSWYKSTHPRCLRLNSFESLWKCLRQLYYDQTQKVVTKEVGIAVTNWLHTDFCRNNNLIFGSKLKPLVGHQGLYGALYYHWNFDTELFQFERERVQLSGVLLALAYTAARPGAIVESNSMGIRNTNEALLYRHCKLKLITPPGMAPILILELEIWLDKGKRHRGE